MQKADVEFLGRCLCGDVKLKLLGNPSKCFACYCRDCQRSAGGPCQIVAVYAKQDVTVIDPQERIHSYSIPASETASGKVKEKLFCGSCGCTVATIPHKWHGEKIVIRTALLEDGMDAMSPSEEWFIRDRPRSSAKLAGTDEFDTIPGS